MRPAVFLDRDGTLMEDVDYCRDPGDVRLYPGTAEALRRLQQHGFLNIVITNQAGIGRGYFTEADYHRVHAEFLRQLGPGLIEATYFCPDAPGQPSTRRKPEPGMLLEAAAAHGLDLARCWFIGDKTSDIECGRRAGTRTILVQTGYGLANLESAPTFLAPDLPAAVASICSQPA